MAIYYCPQCNKKFFIDNIEDVDETVECSMCGCSINFKKLYEEYEQKRQNMTFEEIDTTPHSYENTYSKNTVSTNNKDDISLMIQKKQLEELQSIKSMLKFFTILTVISLIISFISATFILY